MAIKGAILGDILGSQYEFGRPELLDWQNVPLCIPEKAGFTDDTVMMMAIKKTLDRAAMEVAHDLPTEEWLNISRKELIEKSGLIGMSDEDAAKILTENMVDVGRHYPNCGFGGKFYHWIFTDNHKPYNSWGNGSAMRVAYVADFFTELNDVQDWARKTALVSHDHPEGIKGAVVTATCIWMAKNGKSKQDIYDYVLEQYSADQYPYSIDKDMDYLRRNYEWTEKCSDTVPAAMRCFYDSTDYESFMRNIYSFKCDSDTFGAIAGGVAEEFYHGFGDICEDELLTQFLDLALYQILQLGEYYPVEMRRSETEHFIVEAQIIGNNENMFIGRISDSDGEYDYHTGDIIAFFIEKVGEEGFPEFVADISPSRHITAEMLEGGSMLKEAIKTFNADRTEPNFIEILELLRDSYVWIPCNAIMDGIDEEKIMKMIEAAGDDLDSMVGQTFANQEPVRLVPDILQNGDNFFFPVFTSDEEMGEYGDHFSKVEKHFLEALNLAMNHEQKLAGIVVNAFSESFVLDAQIWDLVGKMKSRVVEE